MQNAPRALTIAIGLGLAATSCNTIAVYHQYDEATGLPAATAEKIRGKIEQAGDLCRRQQLATQNPEDLAAAKRNPGVRTDREKDLVLGEALLQTDEIEGIRWEIIAILARAGCDVGSVRLWCNLESPHPMEAKVVVMNRGDQDCMVGRQDKIPLTFLND